MKTVPLREVMLAVSLGALAANGMPAILDEEIDSIDKRDTAMDELSSEGENSSGDEASASEDEDEGDEEEEGDEEDEGDEEATGGTSTTTTSSSSSSSTTGLSTPTAVTEALENNATIEQPISKNGHHTAVGLGIAGGVVVGVLLCVGLILMLLKYKGILPNRYDPFRRFKWWGKRPPPDLQPNGFWNIRSGDGGAGLARPPVAAMTEKPRLFAQDAQTEFGSDETTLFAGKYSERAGGRAEAKAPSYRTSIQSHSSQGSQRSLRLPINAGNTLPRHPSQHREKSNNPFSDEHATDVEQSGNVARSVSIRSFKREPSVRVNSMKSINKLALTDPRVADGRKLVVANRSQDERLSQSPPNAFAPLRVPPRVARKSKPGLGEPVSRFSWSTKGLKTPMQQDRKSGMSNRSMDSQPQFRGIDSWVDHQQKYSDKRLETPEEDADPWSRTVYDYDTKSEHSGMDTRRTMTEY